MSTSTAIIEVYPAHNHAHQNLALHLVVSLAVSQFSTEVFAMANERTFIMIKPDGVQRGLISDIIKRFEQKGFKLVAMKFMVVSYALYTVRKLFCFKKASEDLLKQHYGELSSKPFFNGLVKFIGSGPVVPMVGLCICASSMHCVLLTIGVGGKRCCKNWTDYAGGN